MISRNFYKELGKLLYAVARSEGKITSIEEEALKKLLYETKILTQSNEELILDEDKYLTDFEFKLYKEKNITAKDAFLSFSNFINKNQKHIDDKKRKIAIVLSTKIALAKKGIGKSENKILTTLLETLEIPA